MHGVPGRLEPWHLQVLDMAHEGYTGWGCVSRVVTPACRGSLLRRFLSWWVLQVLYDSATLVGACRAASCKHVSYSGCPGHTPAKHVSRVPIGSQSILGLSSSEQGRHAEGYCAQKSSAILRQQAMWLIRSVNPHPCDFSGRETVPVSDLYSLRQQLRGTARRAMRSCSPAHQRRHPQRICCTVAWCWLQSNTTMFQVCRFALVDSLQLS